MREAKKHVCSSTARSDAPSSMLGSSVCRFASSWCTYTHREREGGSAGGDGEGERGGGEEEGVGLGRTWRVAQALRMAMGGCDPWYSPPSPPAPSPAPAPAAPPEALLLSSKRALNCVTTENHVVRLT